MGKLFIPVCQQYVCVFFSQQLHRQNRLVLYLCCTQEDWFYKTEEVLGHCSWDSGNCPLLMPLCWYLYSLQQSWKMENFLSINCSGSPSLLRTIYIFGHILITIITTLYLRDKITCLGLSPEGWWSVRVQSVVRSKGKTLEVNNKEVTPQIKSKR